MNRQLVYIGNHSVSRDATDELIACAAERAGWTVHRHSQEQAHKDPTPIIESVKACVGEGETVVAYTRTHNQYALQPSWTERWREFEQWGARTCTWHLDLFRGVNREHLVSDGDPLFTAQTVWTADGGAPEGWWADRGVPDHRWLVPAARWPVEHAPYAGEVPDVVFVGTISRYHPEHRPWREQLVRALDGRYGSRFGVFGSDTVTVRGGELTDVYRRAKVVVGDCYGKGLLERYFSDRVPETLARGGVLVHPRVEGLFDQFPGLIIGHEPGNLLDMLSAVECGLQDRKQPPIPRDVVAARVGAFHSWDARIPQILG